MNVRFEILHTHNLKVTPLRKAVLDKLMDARKGLSHQDLNEALALSFDRSSLFRTLNIFEKKGILHKIIDTEGIAKYAFSQTGENTIVDYHAHFFCLKCKNIFCLDYGITLARIQVPEGFEKENVDMQVRGLCAQCLKNRVKNHKKGK